MAKRKSAKTASKKTSTRKSSKTKAKVKRMSSLESDTNKKVTAMYKAIIEHELPA